MQAAIKYSTEQQHKKDQNQSRSTLYTRWKLNWNQSGQIQIYIGLLMQLVLGAGFCSEKVALAKIIIILLYGEYYIDAFGYTVRNFVNKQHS